MEDSQQNRYFRDIFGRMQLPGEFKKDRRPVSLENAEFYYRQGLELIRKPEQAPKIKAIEYWKEILLLPENSFAHQWRVMAARALAQYQKAWGDSFTRLADGIFFLRTEDTARKKYFLHIPRFFVSLEYPTDWEHIEFRAQSEKLTQLEAVLLGRRYAPLIQVVIGCDRFQHYSTMNLENYRRVWQGRILDKKYKRKNIQVRFSDSLANEFVYEKPGWKRKLLRPEFQAGRQGKKGKWVWEKTIVPKTFVGEEHIIRKKNFGYYLAFMAEEKDYIRLRESFQTLLNSLQMNP
jgi:hypothetical protein